VRLILAALLFTLSAPGFSLAPGDNLAAFWKANAVRYTASRVLGPVAGWPGCETAVLATDAAFSQPPFVMVLRSAGRVVAAFGTVEGSAAQATLLLDADGDGVLDVRTKKNLVPGWLAFQLPGKRGDGKAFRALADRMYRQYDQNSGPVPAQMALLVESLRQRAADGSNADRDLEAALVSYLDLAATEPALGAGTLQALSLVLKARGGESALIPLFWGEALGSLGRVSEAGTQFARLLVLDPKSTIGAYKKAETEGPAGLAAFRKAHPDYWAVR